MIYPAIDLIDGNVVRLHKGDFEQQTTYGTNPVAVASAYGQSGASWLHLVDLDGAKNPANRQISLIADIIAGSGLKVQTGGGIRSRADVEALLAAGASRVVIGSLAVRETELVQNMIADFGPESICLAADVVRAIPNTGPNDSGPNDSGPNGSGPNGSGNNDFMIAVSGWQEASKLPLFDFITSFMTAGLRHVLCTDIDRDGTMTGPNTALYSAVKNTFPAIQLQASGGVSGISDLADLPTDGVIIGKAIYERAIDLADALALGREMASKTDLKTGGMS
ncbi:MAG: 1-(5-phosphoribosyl)-5-((5-phosphoribosylamino)methylideneamino)imidazole-4-carboxamide isomerase [Bacteroidetes bacterium]|nr:1-(5-phosphoribosyl)-5-((5-phosphoribosylamino)methylideneamino)imidazole-4-carboxamide isomerase [Bacteroidota bacterium]